MLNPQCLLCLVFSFLFYKLSNFSFYPSNYPYFRLSILFSCPRQLNSWPCHSLSKSAPFHFIIFRAVGRAFCRHMSSFWQMIIRMRKNDHWLHKIVRLMWPSILHWCTISVGWCNHCVVLGWNCMKVIAAPKMSEDKQTSFHCHL